MNENGEDSDGDSISDSPPETMQTVVDDVDLEDFELKRITNYSYKRGYLYLLYELKNGEHVPIPFDQLKKDYPRETALHIKDHVLRKSRGDYHQKWASNILKHRRRTIRRMNRIHGVDKAHRIHIRRMKRAKSTSRNTRVQSRLMKEKFGIKIPNSTKEALLLDKINGDSKWFDAIQKELNALESLGVWKFHRIGHRMPNEHQRAPLRMIFDVKKEDLR